MRNTPANPLRIGMLVLLLAAGAPLLSQDTASVLFSFLPVGSTGSGPGALLRAPDGTLYGTTGQGGTNAMGVVFALTKAPSGTWHESVLHTFTGPGDGAYPNAPLVMDSAGNLFGTTQWGGDMNCLIQGNTVGCGTVFELSPTSAGGWKFTVLHTFERGMKTGAGYPLAGLTIDALGNLYGTTLYGGAGGIGTGTAFQLARTSSRTWKFGIIHVFQGTEGAPGTAALTLDGARNLYGMTPMGGTFANCNSYDCGLVYELIPSAAGSWSLKALYAFTGGGDGALPAGSLIFDALGNIYGVTWAGGTANYGTVFELVPSSGANWTQSVLYSFTETSCCGRGPGADGLEFDGNGNLRGATLGGGLYHSGSVFQLVPGATWTKTDLYSFTGGNDGYNPWGLVLDGAGNIFTATSGGGDPHGGTVVKISPAPISRR